MVLFQSCWVNEQQGAKRRGIVLDFIQRSEEQARATFPRRFTPRWRRSLLAENALIVSLRSPQPVNSRLIIIAVLVLCGSRGWRSLHIRLLTHHKHTNCVVLTAGGEEGCLSRRGGWRCAGLQSGEGC